MRESKVRKRRAMGDEEGRLIYGRERYGKEREREAREREKKEES